VSVSLIFPVAISLLFLFYANRLSHQLRSLLARFRLFDDEENEAAADLNPFGTDSSNSESSSSSSTATPMELQSGSSASTRSSFARGSPATSSSERPLSAYRGAFRASPSSLPAQAAVPAHPSSSPAFPPLSSRLAAASATERVLQSSASTTPSRSGASSTPRRSAFPSLAAASADNLSAATAAANASFAHDKIRLFLHSMTPALVEQLAYSYMIKAELVPHLFAHFLFHATAHSPDTHEWVLGEQALALVLAPQLRNRRMVARLYQMFARADAFGMQFAEFLMLSYALSEAATTEDKTWTAFKVCDFANRLALGDAELRQLLFSALEHHGKTMSETDVSALVRFTIEVGDHNRSGALEYLEFREMMQKQPDFLSMFTVRLVTLFPPLDVVAALAARSASTAAAAANAPSEPIPAYVAAAFAEADRLDSAAASSARARAIDSAASKSAAPVTTAAAAQRLSAFRDDERVPESLRGASSSSARSMSFKPAPMSAQRLTTLAAVASPALSVSSSDSETDMPSSRFADGLSSSESSRPASREHESDSATSTENSPMGLVAPAAVMSFTSLVDPAAKPAGAAAASSASGVSGVRRRRADLCAFSGEAAAASSIAADASDDESDSEAAAAAAMEGVEDDFQQFARGQREQRRRQDEHMSV
jgi:Ca2+-binding EF-hand superfamily protein